MIEAWHCKSVNNSLNNSVVFFNALILYPNLVFFQSALNETENITFKSIDVNEIINIYIYKLSNSVVKTNETCNRNES